MTQALAIDATLMDASWGLARIIRRKAPWDRDNTQFPISSYFKSARDGTGVDIYHFDTGIRATHAEFGGRATNVYDALGNGGGTDPDGHGTMTAGLAAGSTCGVARGSLLWSFRMQSTVNGTPAQMINAVNEALSHYNSRAATGRPAVAQFSAHVSSDTVESAIASLIDAGMVVVAAAGNEGEELGVTRFWYPALTTDVITVGGIGMADLPNYFARDDGSVSRTNFGSKVDILAPGQYSRAADIASDSAYSRTSSSTSGATGVAVGVAACMLQEHSRLTSRAQVQAVKAKLLANATTGKFRSAFDLSPLPDRILYLDPDQVAPETIAGL